MGTTKTIKITGDDALIDRALDILENRGIHYSVVLPEKDPEPVDAAELHYKTDKSLNYINSEQLKEGWRSRDWEPSHPAVPELRWKTFLRKRYLCDFVNRDPKIHVVDICQGLNDSSTLFYQIIN